MGHTALHLLTIVVSAAASSTPRLGERGRTLMCSFGLLTVAALGVHISGGVIEAV